MWPSLGAIGRLIFGNMESIKNVAEVFFGNKKEREATAAANEFNEQIEIHKEQAASYSYQAKDRNAFDSVMDGVNRMPRPLFAFLAIWLITWPMFWPDHYIVSMKALATVPEWVSTFITVVIVFFFGSRSIAKDIPTFVARGKTQALATVAKAEKKAVSAPATTEANPVIDEWRRKQFNPMAD